VTTGGTNFAIGFTRTDLNNSEIRYKKLCIFLYAPYAPCVYTPLVHCRSELRSSLFFFTSTHLYCN